MRALLALFLLAGPAAAQPVFTEHSGPTREYVPVEGQAFIGKILIENEPRYTWGETLPEAVTVTIPDVGAVSFDVKHTLNKPCVDLGLPACPDVWTVTSVPDGYLVRPDTVELEEGTVNAFLVFRYLGG